MLGTESVKASRTLLSQACLAAAAACALISVAGAAAPAGMPEFQWEPQASGVTARLRGMSAVSARVAWTSGAGGTILRTVDGGTTWQQRPVPGGATLDFRDIDAIGDRTAYALSIGPGDASRIYKTADGGDRWDLQFANTDPKIFLDAMAFWDADRGVAVSDSVDGHFVILTTIDGGASWHRVPDSALPPALPGEGAFAASGTNVATAGAGDVWIGTGAGRVLRSRDAGRTWTVASTPVRAGDSAGIFSIAFRDGAHGLVVGGDYRKERDAIANVAVTSDGGSTWRPAAEHGVGGYRSVAAWLPGAAESVIALGPSGADWSSDGGRTWTPMPGEGFDAFSFAKGTRTGWASGDRGRVARLTIRD